MHNALYNRINSCYNIIKQNQNLLVMAVQSAGKETMNATLTYSFNGLKFRCF